PWRTGRRRQTYRDDFGAAACFNKQNTYIRYIGLLRQHEESSGALRAIENRAGNPKTGQRIPRFNFRTSQTDREIRPRCYGSSQSLDLERSRRRTQGTQPENSET